MKLNMENAIEQLRAQLKPIMGQITSALDTCARGSCCSCRSVDVPRTAVVDSLTVYHHEMGEIPITSLVAVSRAQGGGLKVSVFDGKARTSLRALYQLT